MTTGGAAIDPEWRALATQDEAARLAGVRQRFTAVLARPADERGADMQRLLATEVGLNDEGLLAMTLARLRVWHSMEPDDVRILSECVDAARNRLPAPAAMRSTGAVQTAARELRSDEVEALFHAAPSFRNALPAELRAAIEGVAGRERGGDILARVVRKRRPAWQFWRR